MMGNYGLFNNGCKTSASPTSAPATAASLGNTSGPGIGNTGNFNQGLFNTGNYNIGIGLSGDHLIGIGRCTSLVDPSRLSSTLGGRPRDLSRAGPNHQRHLDALHRPSGRR